MASTQLMHPSSIPGPHTLHAIPSLILSIAYCAAISSALPSSSNGIPSSNDSTSLDNSSHRNGSEIFILPRQANNSSTATSSTTFNSTLASSTTIPELSPTIPAVSPTATAPADFNTPTNTRAAALFLFGVGVVVIIILSILRRFAKRQRIADGVDPPEYSETNLDPRNVPLQRLDTLPPFEDHVAPPAFEEVVRGGGGGGVGVGGAVGVLGEGGVAEVGGVEGQGSGVLVEGGVTTSVDVARNAVEPIPIASPAEEVGTGVVGNQDVAAPGASEVSAGAEDPGVHDISEPANAGLDGNSSSSTTPLDNNNPHDDGEGAPAADTTGK
ncbi:hypothetical protein HDU97_007895 [Phlyctochytrium planicorne]|nr:hypothetical protein HDU97_007895 [Phlyctochytrium planicorne]